MRCGGHGGLATGASAPRAALSPLGAPGVEKLWACPAPHARDRRAESFPRGSNPPGDPQRRCLDAKTPQPAAARPASGDWRRYPGDGRRAGGGISGGIELGVTEALLRCGRRTAPVREPKGGAATPTQQARIV
jgi:hypothetical protein